MLFVPHGVRALARNAFSHSSSGARVSKFLHPQAPPPGLFGVRNLSTGRPATSNFHNVFTHSQTLLSRFFARLLAPNIRIPLAPSLSGRALHSSITYDRLGRASIQRGFSLPMRHVVSRHPGIGSVFPRAPASVTPVVQNVGLGNVRTFTSARPLFQNLVENAPISMRTLYEADLDGAISPSTRSKGQRFKSHKQARKGSPLVYKSQLAFAPTHTTSEPTSALEELECYFPTPTPTVTTYLLIPLAPTPTSRMPLSSSTTDHYASGPMLLHPLAELGSVHISHELHSLRVSSLFSRLDQGDVWNKGVQCSAFSHGNGQVEDGEGTCTILKLEFVGWTMAEVKGVIGECGTGWCIMHEEHEGDPMELESNASTDLDENPWALSESSVDPAQTLVLPALDLPASFTDSLISSGSAVSVPSYNYQSSAAEPHDWSDIHPPSVISSGGDHVGCSDHWSTNSSDDEWCSYGLSSHLLDRARL